MHIAGRELVQQRHEHVYSMLQNTSAVSHATVVCSVHVLNEWSMQLLVVHAVFVVMCMFWE